MAGILRPRWRGQVEGEVPRGSVRARSPQPGSAPRTLSFLTITDKDVGHPSGPYPSVQQALTDLAQPAEDSAFGDEHGVGAQPHLHGHVGRPGLVEDLPAKSEDVR